VKPRLVISGGSGLLAVNWAIQMRDLWEVHLLLHHRKIVIPGVACHNVDISTPVTAGRIIDRLAPDLVINSVGLTNVDRCQKDQDLATQCNVTVAVNMALAAKATGSKFVHISTDHLFDGTKPLRSETDQPSPVNHYGMTKWQAENAVVETLAESLIIRTNFFGWGPSYRLSFSDWILLTLENGQPINLFTDAYYTPVYMPNLIEAVHRLFAAGQSGVFNIVGGERLSKYQFGKRLCRVFCCDESLIRPTSLSEMSNLVPRPLDMSLSNDKLLSTKIIEMPDLSTMLESLAAGRPIADLLAGIGDK
jgi:dTDP-4-dehydrorhamnose reductase